MKKRSKILVAVLSFALLLGSVVGVAVSAADTTSAVSVIGGKFDGTGYNNLKSAFDKVNTDDSTEAVTIVLNADATLHSGYALNFTRTSGPVTVDLNGFTITSNVQNKITLEADYVGGKYIATDENGKYVGEDLIGSLSGTLDKKTYDIYGGTINVLGPNAELIIEGNGGTITAPTTISAGIFYLSENAEGSSLTVKNLNANMGAANGAHYSVALIAARAGLVEVDNCYFSTGKTKISAVLHSGNAVMRFNNSRLENYNGSQYHASLIKAQDVATSDSNELSFVNCSLYAGSVMLKGHQAYGNIATATAKSADGKTTYYFTSCLENRVVVDENGNTVAADYYKNTNVNFENCKIEQCDKDQSGNFSSTGGLGSYLTHNTAYHDYTFDGCEILFGWCGFYVAQTCNFSMTNTRMELTGEGDICQDTKAYFFSRNPSGTIASTNTFVYNPEMNYNGTVKTPTAVNKAPQSPKEIIEVKDTTVGDESVKASIRGEDRYVTESFASSYVYSLYTSAYAALENAKHGDVVNLYADAVAVEINTAMTVNTNGFKFIYYSNTYKAVVSADGKTVTFTTANPGEKTNKEIVNEYVDANGNKTNESLGKLAFGSYIIYDSAKLGSVGTANTNDGSIVTGVIRDGEVMTDENHLIVKSATLDKYTYVYANATENYGWMILESGYTERDGVINYGNSYAELASIINGKHAYNLPNGYTIKFFRDYGADEVTTLVFRYSLYEEDARYYVDLNGHTLTDDEKVQFILDPIKAIIEQKADGSEEVHALQAANGNSSYPSAAVLTATGSEVEGVLKIASTKPAHLYIYTSKAGGAIISTASSSSTASIAQNHGQVTGAYTLTGSDGKSLSITVVKNYMHIGMEGMPTLTLKSGAHLPYAANNSAYLYYENVYAEGQGSTYKTYMTAPLYLPQGFNYISNSTFVATKEGVSVISTTENTETIHFTNSTFVSTSTAPVALFTQFGNRMRNNNVGIRFSGCQFYNVYLAAKNLANKTSEMTKPYGPTPFLDGDTTKPRMSAIFDDNCLFNTEYKGDGIGVSRIDGLYWAVLDPAAYKYGTTDKYASLIAPIDLYNGAVLWNNEFTDARSGRTFMMTYTTALNSDVKDIRFVVGTQTYDYKYKVGGTPTFSYEAASGKVYREVAALDKELVKVTESKTYTLTSKLVPTISLLQNLSLYSDFKYNVYIPRYLGDEDVAGYIVSVTINDSTYTKDTLCSVKIGGVEYYVFAEAGIASNETESAIDFTITLTEGGKTIVGEKTLSVAGYLKTALESTSSVANPAEYKLYQATLNYTKCAYDAFGGMASVVNTLWDKYCGEEYSTLDMTGTAESVSGIGLYSAALNLDSAPKFRFYVLSATPDEFIPLFSGNLSVSYPYNDTVKVKSIDAGTLKLVQTGEQVEGGYKWYFEVELRAYQITKDITVTVGDKSGVYNLASYYAGLSNEHKSGEAGAVVRALYNYSKYAEGYLESKGGKMTVNYVLDGGTLPEGEWEFVANDKDFTLPTPTKEGYAFAGWYTSSDYADDAAISKIAAGTKSVSVYAKWNEVVFFHDAEGLMGVTHNSSFTNDPNNKYGLGEDGYFYWYQAKSDKGPEHTYKANLTSALNGSKIFTVDINVAKSADENPIASAFRIRATNPDDTSKIIAMNLIVINGSGEVFVGSNVKIADLSEEIQSIRVAVDFDTGKLYGYNNQTGTVVSTDMIITGGADKDSFYNWMTAYAWQWSVTAKEKSELKIESVGVYAGDALVKSTSVTTLFGGSNYDYSIAYDEDDSMTKTAAEYLAIRMESLTGKKPLLYGASNATGREVVIGNVDGVSEELYAKVAALADADSENEYFAIKYCNDRLYVAASCDDAYTNAIKYFMSTFKKDGTIVVNDKTDIAFAVSADDLLISSRVDATPHDVYMSYEIADNFFDAYADPFNISDDELNKITLVHTDEKHYDMIYADDIGGTYRVTLVRKFWGMWILGGMEYTTVSGTVHKIFNDATEYEFVLRCGKVGGNSAEIRSGNHGAFAMAESDWNGEDTTLTNDRFLDMTFYDGKTGGKVDLAIGESVTLDGVRMVLHHNVYEDEYCAENVLLNVERSYLFNGYEVLFDAKLYSVQDMEYNLTYSACMPISKKYGDRAIFYHDDGTYSYYMTPNYTDRGVNAYRRGIQSSRVDLFGSENPEIHMIVTLFNPDLMLAFGSDGGYTAYRNMLGGTSNKVYFGMFSQGTYTCLWGTELEYKNSWRFEYNEDFVAPSDDEIIEVVGPVATPALLKEEN